jgi:hypothetical protein
MSESVLLAGKRGSGKSLCAIDMARKYMLAGRPVATNLNLYLEKLLPGYCKTRAYRLPDFPTAIALHALPLGNPFLEWQEGEPDPVMKKGFDEGANGLLILDEVATFLNSREWNLAGRQDIISWLVQSRKYGWDLCFIAQHCNLLDKQIRESLIEIQGTVRRLDKIAIPFLSAISNYFIGRKLHFPKIHLVNLLYGFQPGAPLSDRLLFTGKDLYEAYDTLQRISSVTGQQGISTMLSAWELKGRYMKKWELRQQMAAGGLVIGLLIGLAGGVVIGWYQFGKQKPVEIAAPNLVVAEKKPEIKIRGMIGSDITRLMLTDGRTVIADGYRMRSGKAQYSHEGIWYEK